MTNDLHERDNIPEEIQRLRKLSKHLLVLPTLVVVSGLIFMLCVGWFLSPPRFLQSLHYYFKSYEIADQIKNGEYDEIMSRISETISKQPNKNIYSYKYSDLILSRVKNKCDGVYTLEFAHETPEIIISSPEFHGGDETADDYWSSIIGVYYHTKQVNLCFTVKFIDYDSYSLTVEQLISVSEDDPEKKKAELAKLQGTSTYRHVAEYCNYLNWYSSELSGHSTAFYLASVVAKAKTINQGRFEEYVGGIFTNNPYEIEDYDALVKYRLDFVNLLLERAGDTGFEEFFIAETGFDKEFEMPVYVVGYRPANGELKTNYFYSTPLGLYPKLQ